MNRARATLLFVGIQPRFPGPLGRWRWLNEAVPAERAAALRIATALALLLDIGLSLLPGFAAFFTADGLAGRDAYPWRFRPGHYYWSALRWLPDAWGPPVLMAVWIVGAIALLVGYRPFLSGLLCWFCAVSFWNINPWITNGGDQLRNTLILSVAVAQTGAVWGVQSVRRDVQSSPVFVPGWPFKVLLVQLICMYFFSGVHKLLCPAWRSGDMMYFVNHDLTWSLLPKLTSALPIWADRLATWTTLVWELGFPVLIVFRRTRPPTLWVGVAFHVLTLLTLEVGMFAIYALVWYAIFVPWDRFRVLQQS